MGFLPVNLHFAKTIHSSTKLSVSMNVGASALQANKNQIMQPLTLQLGHVIERYIEIERSAQTVKIRHFLTFLPVRSSENDNDHPHLLVYLAIHKYTKKKSHISLETLAEGC